MNAHLYRSYSGLAVWLRNFGLYIP
jgi:hypothetical protein